MKNKRLERLFQPLVFACKPSCKYNVETTAGRSEGRPAVKTVEECLFPLHDHIVDPDTVAHRLFIARIQLDEGRGRDVFDHHAVLCQPVGPELVCAVLGRKLVLEQYILLISKLFDVRFGSTYGDERNVSTTVVGAVSCVRGTAR